jgi:hypothetical protein
MTLCIAAGNADQIIQVNDRRITAAGALVDDSVSKGGVLHCDDADLLYCFTGLATYGSSHTTSRWIPEALGQAASRFGNTYGELVHGLSAVATEYFAAAGPLQSLSPADRRLTIMLTGYDNGGLLVNSLISNYQDFVAPRDYIEAQSSFTYHMECSRDKAEKNPTMIQAVGALGLITAQDEAEVREMLEQRVPGQGIRAKLVDLVQELADRPGANGLIGKKVTSLRLIRGSTGPVVGYASDESQDYIPLADQVTLKSGRPQFMIADAKMSTAGPLVHPKVHRNAHCPCGSGRRYRDCHRPRVQ